ncbi:MAG: glycosyltransferase family 4 protein [Bacteroidota bacterium]|nr:glycosyltransferase family 4 protein [Bacteroidota bacterium]
MYPEKLLVTYFQRKARSAGNFSVEIIFEDVRERLRDRISADTVYSRYESAGLFKRFFNCLQAWRQQKGINHVTGDINYVGLLLNPRTTIHTILDCVFLERSTGIKHKVLKFFWLTIPIRRSTYITAISESTKKEILKYAKCDPTKIIVVPVAISDKFSRRDKPFNKQKPILLQVGTAPNKNLPRLIEAIRGISCQLHIVGKFEISYEQLLKENGIDYTYQSGLTEEAMIAKYAEADMIVFASTYEGFGMPILEAQTVGRPVLTSNILSMPEVAGEAACLVDPFDTAAIRAGILKIIDDDAYRSELVEKGFRNTTRFHGQLIAEQYLELYRRVAKENSGKTS